MGARIRINQLDGGSIRCRDSTGSARPRTSSQFIPSVNAFNVQPTAPRSDRPASPVARVVAIWFGVVGFLDPRDSSVGALKGPHATQGIIRKRLKCHAVADRAGGSRRKAVRLYAHSAKRMRVDLNVEFERTSARGVQATDQDVHRAAVRRTRDVALGARGIGEISTRIVDGWQSLDGKPANQIVDLAA